MCYCQPSIRTPVCDKCFDTLLQDAKRYQWLRKRLQVKLEKRSSLGEPRETINIRREHQFLYSKLKPESAWCDETQFTECCKTVDSAIDLAIKLETP